MDPVTPSYLDDTWGWSTPTPATVTTYGAGCPGTAGVPVLANDDSLLPWVGDTMVMRVSNLATSASAAFFTTGLTTAPPSSLAAFGMPGCNQLLAPATTQFALVASGSATWQLAIPNTAALAGVHLAQQALILESGVNAAGAIVSNGAELVAGIR
jgi:hypothetical protein